jgi:hypothetical protein
MSEYWAVVEDGCTIFTSLWRRECVSFAWRRKRDFPRAAIVNRRR